MSSSSRLTERYIAIDNVCAWPNLTRMPDGAIVATIFNQPCHGLWEGDVECWASTDEGCTWQRRGTPAPHDPGTNRMNVAAGLAANGDLIVLASGWTNRPALAAPGQEQEWRPAGLPANEILHPWVCRSADGGRTWQREGTIDFAPQAEGFTAPIPFGDVVRCHDGTLAVGVYAKHERSGSRSFLVRSRDDGQTWGEATAIAGLHGEPTLIALSDGRLLAAVRGQNLDLYESQDAGATWQSLGPVTGCRELPGHLLELSDGRVLLCYGIRHHGFYGVGARLSDDGGRIWYTPIVLVNLDDAHDGGYPSSVQSPDGTIVTAYYARGVAAHCRYHMGVLRWNVDGATQQNRPQNWPSP